MRSQLVRSDDQELPPTKRIKTESRCSGNSSCWIQDLQQLSTEQLEYIREIYKAEPVLFLVRNLRNVEVTEIDWMHLPEELLHLSVYKLVNGMGKLPYALSQSDKEGLRLYYLQQCQGDRKIMATNFINALEKEQIHLNDQCVAALRQRIELFATNIKQAADLDALIEEGLSFATKMVAEFAADVADWRRKQQALSAVRFDDDDGSPPSSFMKNRLDFLRNRSEELTRLLLLLRRSANAEEPFDERVRSVLQSLTQASFLITVQPNQIVCKRKLFEVTAELLNVKALAPALSNSHRHEVNVRIISESGLETLLSNREPPSVATMNSIDPPSLMEPRFEKLQWITVLRNDEGEVSEQKYYLHLDSTVTFKNRASFKINVFSLPIILTTHKTLQGQQAAATIFWHNAFANPLGSNRQIAREPQQTFVVLRAIRRWIGYTTGRLPLENDMNFLRAWLATVSNTSADSISFKDLASQNVFDNKKGVSFTLWEWIYSVKRLIQSEKLLKILWQNNLVCGFIGLEEAKRLLESNQLINTMLLRFSCSKLGAITITAHLQSGEPTESIVGWNLDELSKMSLKSRMACLSPDYIFTYAKPQQRKWRHLLQRVEVNRPRPPENDARGYKSWEVNGIRINGSNLWLKNTADVEFTDNDDCSDTISNFSLNNLSSPHSGQFAAPMVDYSVATPLNPQPNIVCPGTIPMSTYLPPTELYDLPFINSTSPCSFSSQSSAAASTHFSVASNNELNRYYEVSDNSQYPMFSQAQQLQQPPNLLVYGGNFGNRSNYSCGTQFTMQQNANFAGPGSCGSSHSISPVSCSTSSSNQPHSLPFQINKQLPFNTIESGLYFDIL